MEAAAASSGCSESGSPHFAAVLGRPGPPGRRWELPAQNLARRPLACTASGSRALGQDLLPTLATALGGTVLEAAPVAEPVTDPEEHRAVRELEERPAGLDSEADWDRVAAVPVAPADLAGSDRPVVAPAHRVTAAEPAPAARADWDRVPRAKVAQCQVHLQLRPQFLRRLLLR